MPRGERRLAEHRVLQRRRRPQGGRSGALEEVRDVTLLQFVFARERLEIRAGLAELGLQLLLDFSEAVGRPVASHLGLELRTRRLEGLAFDGLNLIQADNVIAKLGLDRTFDLADRHAEQRVRKRRDEGTAFGPAQIPAVVRGPWIL